MKQLLIATLSLLLCVQTAVIAQKNDISYSASFEEPEEGWNKLLQLTNGNTFFFHFTKKNGIEVTVYDAAHKVKATNVITSQLWNPKKMNQSAIEGLYEINGEPVLFLHQLLDRTPTLFHLRLDPNTGAVLKEKQMGTIARYGTGAAWALAYGGVERNDFFIEKDPASDCYAVVYFNGFAHESGERIEVVHYSGAHKILSKSYYDAPNNAYKYLRYIGMTVNGEKQVHLCTYGYNKKGGGGNSKVILSRMRNGETAFTHKELDFTDDFFDTRAIMQYNPGTKKIQLLTLTFLQAKRGSNYYATLLTTIDPETMFVTGAKMLTNNMASAYATSKLESNDGFHGLPQNMIINPDNTTTIISEEIVQIIRRSSTGNIVSANTSLGTIGITELDRSGEEQVGIAIPKLQQATGILEPMYQYQRGKGLWSYRGGGMSMMGNNNAFLSFDYFSTLKNHYVVFNDYPENYDNPTVKKRKTVASIGKANTICYRIENGVMKRSYLFGKPGTDDESNFCYIESSNFLTATNTYATLLMKRNGRDKKAYIAWVSFDK